MAKPAVHIRFLALLVPAIALGAGCALETELPAVGADAGLDEDHAEEDYDDSDLPGEGGLSQAELDAELDALAEELREEGETDVELAARQGMPFYQLPFRCGQRWYGQTRSGHSPTLAVDFNRTGDFGDAVLAAAHGVVTRSEHEGNVSYGRWIEIGHGGGHRTRYAHLSGERVYVGQRVRKGQRIGSVGNSGGSYGSHLHYEQRTHRGSRVVHARFNGNTAFYFGTRRYRSHNCR